MVLAMDGGTQKIIICPNCDGTKKDPENPTQNCKDCHGTGKVGAIKPAK